MKSNQQLLRINRNFLICFVVSALFSAAFAQMLSDYDNYLNTTFTIIFGYVVYFVIFSGLFYLDNKDRFKSMRKEMIRRELFTLVSSFGVGEIVYLTIRWPTFYYFLEIGIEPFAASLISEIIATCCYMASVTLFLRKTKTY